VSDDCFHIGSFDSEVDFDGGRTDLAAGGGCLSKSTTQDDGRHERHPGENGPGKRGRTMLPHPELRLLQIRRFSASGNLNDP
jgi:hypothetical protein